MSDYREEYYQKAKTTAAQVKAQFPELDVTIAGTWVWIGGTDKGNASQRAFIKACGGRWSKGKGKWFVKGMPSTSRRDHSYQEIVNLYGEEEIAV